MATFQRMIPRSFQAFQFNNIENAQPLTCVMELWDIISAEMDRFPLQQVSATKVGNKAVLEILESRYDYVEGGRVPVLHVAGSTDWLVESGETFSSMPDPVRLYEVMTHEQFLAFSQQKNI